MAQNALKNTIETDPGLGGAHSGTRRTGRGVAVSDARHRARGDGRDRTPIPARADRRSGGRAAVCRRVFRPGAEREGAGLAPVPGGAGRARHLLRPALSPQPGDARHPRGDCLARRRHRSGRAERAHSLHEAVLDQQRPLQQPHGAKIRAATAAERPDSGGRGGRAARARGSAWRRARPSPSSIDRYAPMFFDPGVDPMVTCKTPGGGRDILLASANNLYDGVTMADLAGVDERYPLNSRVVKQDGARRRAGLPRRRALRRGDPRDRAASRRCACRTRRRRLPPR